MTNLQLVKKVDQWAQDNRDQKLELQLDRIYRSAKNSDYGWESVEESSPDLFKNAVQIAKNNFYKLTK